MTTTVEPATSTELLSVYVPGKPAPQGSKAYLGASAQGRPRVADASPRLRTWRHDVITAASPARRLGHPYTGPVEVMLVFALPRPASHYLPANRRRPEPVLRPESPTWPSKPPDGDKLARAVLDALTGAGLWADDGQVCRLNVTKVYVGPGESPPGVHIVARTMPERGADG